MATILLVCFMMMTFAVNAFAATPKVSPDMQKLIGDYNLNITDKFPAGVQPVEYKTIAEARSTLEKIKTTSESNKARVAKNLAMVKAAASRLQTVLIPYLYNLLGIKSIRYLPAPTTEIYGLTTNLFGMVVETYSLNTQT